ncbi:MAG TPA: hypothetical protein VGL78_11695 [Solirubrobacteraceae bacterium]
MAEEDDPRSQEDENAGESEENGGNGDGNGQGGIGESIVGELRNAVREAAMEVLGPAARQATGSAAKYAVKKGPEVMTKNVMPAVQERGGPGEMLKQATGGKGVAGMAGKALSKLTGGGGGGAATGWGRNRRMPVQQFVYCSVPVRHAFNGFTEYNEWATYMHRANQVDEQIDEEKVRVKVTEKMWGFKRPFTAEVVAQKPDQSIRWESKDGTKHAGVINFHELGPRLTLVEVNLDHSPSGMVEKFARGTRFVKRAVRADFHRFQAWIEMKTEDELEEMEGWRGTVEDSEIVKSHEDTVAEEREQEGDQEGEYDEEPEGEYQEEPEGEGEEEPEAEAEEEPEEEAEEEPEGEGEEEPEAEGEEQPEDEGEEQPEAEAEEEPEEEPEQQRPRRRRASSGQQESEQAQPRRRRSSGSSRASSGGRSGGGRSS